MASTTTPTTLDPYAESERAIHEADREVTRREQELEAAPEVRWRLLTALKRGDETVTAADLAGADHEEARRKALLDGAKERANKARRTGPFRPTVALELAATIAEALEVEVEIVDATPATFDKPGDPLVVIRQAAVTLGSVGGRLRCEEIEVHHVRSVKHSAPDWKSLEIALQKAHGATVTVSSRSNSRRGEAVVDHAVIFAGSILPGQLVIDPDAAATGWAKSVADEALSAGVEARGTGHSMADSGATLRPILEGVEATTVTVKREERAGKVITTVDARISARPGSGFSGEGISERDAEALKAGAKTLNGKTLEGLGYCTGIRVTKTSHGARLAHCEFKATFEALSTRAVVK